MSKYDLKEGIEVRVPNLIFEDKDSSEVENVMFFQVKIDRVEEDYVYLSTLGDNDHYDGERFPRDLVQAWQYKPYFNVSSYDEKDVEKV